MRSTPAALVLCLMFFVMPNSSRSDEEAYAEFPDAEPPYFRVRYEAGTAPNELQFPVSYTIWIPPNTDQLRGIVVHQHGCGEGSCRSGATGAFDLHWQALAEANQCGLLAAVYEQPQEADCQLWCDPRNGSADRFMQALSELGRISGHPELESVPWALWGHSGGGHWAGGMLMLYPERVAAVWLRSGVPLTEADETRPRIRPHTVPESALVVPVMCNPGTKEGVTVTDGRFARVWPANKTFFHAMRSRSALVGVAVDPLTSHECGNQRYLAVPWFHACLRARLSPAAPHGLLPMPTDDAWLAELPAGDAVPRDEYEGDPLAAVWLPDRTTARRWQQYVRDTQVSDETPPPAPEAVTQDARGLKWTCPADPESGIARFEVCHGDTVIAVIPESSVNRFGRPLFQGLQYSDTPVQPLTVMEFRLDERSDLKDAELSVRAVNTVELKSKAVSATRVAAAQP